MGDQPALPIASTRFEGPGAKKGSVPPGAELPRGASLGRYTIIRRIGAGGMGLVYLAFDPELDRRVAVKLLRTRGPAAGGSEGEARLLREAQVMAKLSHPNVITVFDVGTFEGDVFIAMEYVKGPTLREWWTAEARDPLATIAIVTQAGRGLAAAHQQGILHRDFKPENVLVDEQGRARVLDFGLARSSGGGHQAHEAHDAKASIELEDTLVGKRSSLEVPVTQIGTLLGTPAYMAPEQLKGGVVDARSDQLAFCITAYEALFGERPYAGETVAQVVASMEAGRVRTPAKRAGVPRGVLPVLARGLAPKPQDRWASMDDLLDALDRATAGSGLRMGAIAVALGAACVLAATTFAVARPKAPTCSGADQPLGGVWDGAARDAVAGAFRASESANAEPILGRVTKALDDYAGGWVAASTDACVATRVRGTQSDEALDLRSACLRARLDDLRALTDLLRKADPALVDNAYGAVLRLRPLAACADVPALRAAHAPIESEAMQRDVDQLRHDVASVVARFNAGRCEEAMPLVKPIVAPREAPYLPARAEAFYWAARVEQSCGDPKVAADYLFRAASDAQESHQDELLARVLLVLAHVEGSGLSRYEEGMDVARLAEAAIRRAGATDALLGELARVRGWVEYTQGNLDAALPLRREALERHARAVSGDDPDAIQMRAELADLEYEAGELKEALAAEKDLLQRSTELLGPRHWRTGRYTLDVAETLVAQGEYAEASRWLERARPIVKGGTAKHFVFVEAIEKLGTGDVDEAVAALLALITEAEGAVGADDPEPLAYKADLAKWLAVRGRTKGSLDVAQPLVKRIEELKDTRNSWYTNAYAALGLGLARTGRGEEALAPAKHGVELAEHAGAQLPFALLARAEAALANDDHAAAIAAAERGIALATKREGVDGTVLADLKTALALAKAP